MSTQEIVAENRERSDVPPAARWATVTFLTLFAMSLLDHTDRSVLSALLPQVITDLKLTNTQAGFLPTWFLISYSLVSPLIGYAGDRFKRTRLLVIGVGVWSVATMTSGLARNYVDLSLSRALLGVGAATFGVIAPTLLMDLFTRDRRARVMSLFYLSMPLGAALGMSLAGWIAQEYSWHLAFFVVGLPGLLAAIGVLFLSEPTRGMSEEVDPARLAAHLKAGPSREDYVDLMVNSSFTYAVMGMAFYTFAIGGLVHWTPTFLVNSKGFDPLFATKWLAITTFLAAVAGMTTGGWLADRLLKTYPRALFLLPSMAMLASVPLLIAAIFSKQPAQVFGFLFCAEALMFVNIGPCNAVIANVVMPHMRAVAFAATLFAVHVFGDLWSGALIGWVSDTFGKRDSMASIYGQWLTMIGAVPTLRQGQFPMNLTAGMLVVVPALVMSGLVLLAGARHVPREMELMLAKLRARPSHSPHSNGPAKSH